MNPYLLTERLDVANAADHQLTPSASYSQIASAPRPEPPDARLVAKLEALTTRVEILEKRLKSLSECAVQQFWDGRLHLPAGGVFRVEIGQSKLTMDGGRFTVVVNGQTIVASGSAPGALSTAGIAGSSKGGSSIGSMNQSNVGSANQAHSSWQSTAQSNSISDPRTGHGGDA